MKIMHVVESYGGGVFTSVNQLCNGFAEKHEVLLVHGLREETPSNFKNALHSRVRLVEIPFTREIRPATDLQSLRALIALLRSEEPDVVHLHSSKAGFIGRLACAWLKHPAVFYSPRAFSFLDPATSPIKRTAYRLLEKIGASLGGTIVGCSEDEALEARGIARRIAQINNSIDFSFLEEVEKKVAASPGPAGRPLTVGVHARVREAKRPDLFLEVAKIVKSSRPDVRFMWIGGGDPFFENTPEVQCTGWLSRKEALEALCREVDLYLLTSAYEGLPLSVVEAAGLGIPSVCTAVSGTRSAVKEGVSGFLCPPGDAQALACKVLQLVNDYTQRNALAVGARRHAKQEFDTPLMLSRYEALYTEALRSGKEGIPRVA